VKVVAVVVATFWVMMAIRTVAEILRLRAVSLILAVGMDPLIVWPAERSGISRGRVVVVLGAAFAALVVLFAALVVPAAIRQLGSLSNDLPAYLSRVQAQVGWAGSFMQRTEASRRPRRSSRVSPAGWAAPSAHGPRDRGEGGNGRPRRRDGLHPDRLVHGGAAAAPRAGDGAAAA